MKWPRLTESFDRVIENLVHSVYNQQGRRQSRSWHLVVAAFFIIISGASGGGPQEPSDKAVVRLDSALDSLISPDTQLELVKRGFGITEGPTWVQKGTTGYLLFSDIPANVIYKMTPDGKSSIHMEKSGYTKPDIWRVGFIQTNRRAIEVIDREGLKKSSNGAYGVAEAEYRRIFA